MSHSIDLLESRLKEETEFINFALRHRDKANIRNQIIHTIQKAKSYKKALKVLKPKHFQRTGRSIRK